MLAGESQALIHHSAVISSILALRPAAFIDGIDTVFLEGHTSIEPVWRARFLSKGSDSHLSANLIAEGELCETTKFEHLWLHLVVAAKYSWK